MQAIKAETIILDILDGDEILRKIEYIARTCYKSEDKITDESAPKMVKSLIKRGHEAMLEHVSFSVKFIVDRGISHELVRHRLASFAQESTRYCNYGKENKELTFILPYFLKYKSPSWNAWLQAMKESEKQYLKMIEDRCTPEEARSVLPNSLKTEVVMTANLRQWRHFFKLRASDITGKAHPQMKEVTIPLLEELKELIPVVFDDIEVGGVSNERTE